MDSFEYSASPVWKTLIERTRHHAVYGGLCELSQTDYILSTDKGYELAPILRAHTS